MPRKVVKINARRGMVAVADEEGSFSVFELMGSAEINLGDEVSWAVGNTSGIGMKNSKNDLWRNWGWHY